MLLDGPRNKGIFVLWYFSSQLQYIDFGNMNYMSNEDGVIPALPDIRDILSDEFCEHIFSVLANIPNETFDESVCVQRDVSRVPLKLDPITPEEEIFLRESNDGLRHFECFDIHDSNVQ